MAEIGNSNVFLAHIQVISKKRSSPKLKRILRPKSEIQTVFQPIYRSSPKKKKKKKKKVFTKIETDFSAEIGNSNGFSANSRQLLLNFGTQIPLGGLFSFFEQNSATKALKTCDFAYFSSSPPPLSLATLLLQTVT